jgi:hypothetical protein
MLWNQPRRLYVAEFKSGVIKVGITKTTKESRESNLRFNGERPVRMHCCAMHECGFWAEMNLIQRLRRIAMTQRGREWFTGVRFNAAKNLAEQVTRMAHALSAQEQEAA